MSNIVAGVSLTTLTFPDITGATINAYGTVSLGYGLNYTTGGIPFGLVAYADARTIDFNGFLKCTIIDENVSSASVYTFRYVPATDAMQIYSNGTELANGAVLPTALLTDSSLIFQATWDRTSTRG